MDQRVPWDQYFMNIAQVVASRSTCPRKLVGSVIVRDRTILSTGYNGSIRGMPHCTEAGHMMENDHCVATIHAEANAIIQSATLSKITANRTPGGTRTRTSTLEESDAAVTSQVRQWAWRDLNPHRSG